MKKAIDSTELDKMTLSLFGANKFIDDCIEECSELIHALSKLKRERIGAKENVEEELADVKFTTRRVAMLVDSDNIDKWLKTKEERAMVRNEAMIAGGKEAYKDKVKEADEKKIKFADNSWMYKV